MKPRMILQENKNKDWSSSISDLEEREENE